MVVVFDDPEQNIRKVEILSNCKTEKIVLFLQQGDRYAMNGKIQKYYQKPTTKWSKPVMELQLRPRSWNSVVSALYFDTVNR